MLECGISREGSRCAAGARRVRSVASGVYGWGEGGWVLMAGQGDSLGSTEHLDSLQNSGIRSPKPLPKRCPPAREEAGSQISRDLGWISPVLWEPGNAGRRNTWCPGCRWLLGSSSQTCPGVFSLSRLSNKPQLLQRPRLASSLTQRPEAERGPLTQGLAR